MKSWLAFAIGGMAAALVVTAVYQKKFSDQQAAQVASTAAAPVAEAPVPAMPAEQPPPAASQPAPVATAPSPVGAPKSAAPKAQTPPKAAPQPSVDSNGPSTPIVTPPAQPPVSQAQVETPSLPPAQPAPAPKAAEPPKPAPRVPQTVTLAEGTLLPVRIMERISTETHQPGDAFSATLDQPLVVDGFVIAERGAKVSGKVSQAVEAGRVKGVAHLAVELTQFTTADGQKIDIRTAEFVKEGEKSTGRDAAKVGIGAAVGSAIGAIAGGGKGAAIGAAAGAGAGTGAVLATRGKAAELAVETRLTFRLAEAVKITERLK